MLRRWGVTVLLALIAYAPAVATVHAPLYLYGRSLYQVRHQDFGFPKQFGGNPFVLVALDLVFVAIWWATWALHRRSLKARYPENYRTPLIVTAASYFLWLPFAAWVAWRELFVGF